jgi:hypothetical protein
MTASGPETVTAERPPEVAAFRLAFKPAVSTAEVMAGAATPGKGNGGKRQHQRR